MAKGAISVNDKEYNELIFSALEQMRDYIFDYDVPVFSSESFKVKYNDKDADACFYYEPIAFTGEMRACVKIEGKDIEFEFDYGEIEFIEKEKTLGILKNFLTEYDKKITLVFNEKQSEFLKIIEKL